MLRVYKTKMKDVAGRLKELRESKSAKQTDFSNRLGVPLRSYQGYENGEHPISIALLLELSKQGVSIDWLLTGEGNPTRLMADKEITRLSALADYWESKIKLLEIFQEDTQQLLVDKYGEEVLAILEQARPNKTGEMFLKTITGMTYGGPAIADAGGAKRK